MNFTTRLARVGDLSAYTDLLQRSYVATYVSNEIGLTKEFFSPEVFATDNSQAYLRSNLQNTTHQKTWFAFDTLEKLIGSITVEDKGEECEVRGFYVTPERQGQGIGHHLWDKAQTFARGKEIVLDLYLHNQKAIDIYQHWGFEIDTSKAHFFRHWSEWPVGLEVECIYLHFKQPQKDVL